MFGGHAARRRDDRRRAARAGGGIRTGLVSNSMGAGSYDRAHSPSCSTASSSPARWACTSPSRRSSCWGPSAPACRRGVRVRRRPARELRRCGGRRDEGVLHRGAETRCRSWSACSGVALACAARALGRRRDAGPHRRSGPLRLRGGVRDRGRPAVPEPVDYAGRTDQQIALTMLERRARAPAARARGARGGARAARGAARRGRTPTRGCPRRWRRCTGATTSSSRC